MNVLHCPQGVGIREKEFMFSALMLHCLGIHSERVIPNPKQSCIVTLSTFEVIKSRKSNNKKSFLSTKGPTVHLNHVTFKHGGYEE